MYAAERRAVLIDPARVLVLGSKKSGALLRSMRDIGLSPILCTRLSEGIIRLRGEKCSAVVVDKQNVETDILEFLLNVRDVDPSVRVFVVKPERSKGPDLPFVPDRVFLVTEKVLVEKLTPSIQPLPEVSSGKEGRGDMCHG